ncbi:hypothetical protein CQA66_06875 [Helicobacter aurati]|uniref:Glycosyl transferase family 25 domain-containing protein n=1 Tax=Helicobacter aurati TaxID=137778 RepID=A0A3D8J140_9HELI|nr:glycosyltransferase family 25 protein [Helicobacter aurati]RDU71259.1 hypothetical protein CQA66_06875 [Helicobacter aurati]
MQFFIINLEKSLDRREKMQTNIAMWQEQNPDYKDKITFHFFKAKTPQDVRESGFMQRYNRFLAWVWKARDVRENELACFFSHFTLWEKCVELNTALFIIEDDVDFTAYLGSGAEDIAQCPYEYVRFCWSTFRRMLLVNDKFAFGHPLILGMMGYYITPNAAKKLIKNAEKIYLAVDYYLSHSFIHGVIEMVYIRPLVTLNELDKISTIGKPEHQIQNKADKTRYKKFVIVRELHRIYRQVRTICFAVKHIFTIKTHW